MGFLSTIPPMRFKLKKILWSYCIDKINIPLFFLHQHLMLRILTTHQHYEPVLNDFFLNTVSAGDCNEAYKTTLDLFYLSKSCMLISLSSSCPYIDLSGSYSCDEMARVVSPSGCNRATCLLHTNWAQKKHIN